MKKKHYLILLIAAGLVFSSHVTRATATVKITTSSIAAANVNQGTSSLVVYAAKMEVTNDPVTVNSITYKLGGSHDDDDLLYTYVYYNPNTPDLSGAIYLGGGAATYDASHGYTFSINRTLVAGEDGYFVITVNISGSAKDNKTVQINGDTDPVSFGYTTSPSIDDQQSNKAKAQTFQAADLTITTNSIPAADVNQGTTGVIVYAAKVVNATMPLTVNSITYKLKGSHDDDDLLYTYVYYNPGTPDLSGAIYLGGGAATYDASHSYTFSINRALAVGEDGYFVITVNISGSAKDNKTVQINGDTDPVSFGYTTDPNEDDQQSNKAKAQKFQAADLTITTNSIPAADVAQVATGVIVYAAKVVNATMPLTVNSITYKLGGSHDDDDLLYTYMYYNPGTPDLSGAIYLGGGAATYDASHSYTFSINRALAVGEDGYFVITVNISSSATIGKTVTINGSTDPVSFGYVTDPNVTDNQSNAAGKQTIVDGLLKSAGELAANDELPVQSFLLIDDVYPNPASSIVHYSIKAQQDGEVTVYLINQQGRMVWDNRGTVAAGINELTMDASELPNGIYMLVASGGQQSGTVTKRIVVQH